MYWNERGARPYQDSVRAAAASRLTFQRSQTAVISRLRFLRPLAIVASPSPRRPHPMCPSEMRSFAPRMRV